MVKNPRMKRIARAVSVLYISTSPSDYDKLMARELAVESFKEQFDEADLDGDGFIDQDQLVNSFEGKINPELSAAEKQQ